ncbi:hypothetical protein [Bacillus sp. FJAT-45350]|uniref:hypothetical protein n=1 Tax=Bacillus sp. FJAT-45350 TaxID=2011014 RepID=UPI000BB6B9C5|nr:hypothetical protein [Bacillus sp. FJAT-45350]
MKKVLYLLCFLLLVGCANEGDLTEETSSSEPKEAPVEEFFEEEEEIEQDKPEVEVEPEVKEELDELIDEEFMWEGQRIRYSSFHEGTLSISDVSDSGFSFKLHAVNGANMGDIWGDARFINGFGFYYDGEGCELVFEPIDDGIQIEANESCLYYGGMGVYFDGEYVREVDEKKEDSLVEFDIFKTKEQDEHFRELVGDDYVLFTDRLQLIQSGEDLDRVGAEVYLGGVRGLFSIMEAIIMFNHDNEFWAAALVDDEVYYYTNVDNSKENIPETIRKWINNFGNVTVEFR